MQSNHDIFSLLLPIFLFSQNLLSRLLGCSRNQSVSHNLPVLNIPNKFKEEGWDTAAKKCTDFQDLHQETWRKLEQNDGWHPKGLSSSDKFPDLRKPDSHSSVRGDCWMKNKTGRLSLTACLPEARSDTHRSIFREDNSTCYKTKQLI